MSEKANRVDWVEVRLGEVCAAVRSAPPVEFGLDSFDYLDIASIDNSRNRIVNPKRYRACEAPSRARQQVQAEDVLFSTVRTYLKNIAMVDARFDGQIASTGFCVLRPCGVVLPHFLFYLTVSQSFLKPLNELQRGTSYPAVREKDVLSQTLPLPPLLEQRAIVSKIEALFSELDKGVEQLETARRQLKHYRQSVLKAAFEGKLTAAWRAAQPDRPSAEELPQGWRWAVLDEVLPSIQAGKSFRCAERPPEHDEVGVVKVSAVSWGTFREEESKTCVDQTKINQDYFIAPGDFLFSRANTIELVGACVIVAGLSKHLMLSDKILRFSWDGVVPQYALQWLRSARGRHEIERLATGNQNSMRNISQRNIKSIPIPLPPLPEQRQIVAEIERRFSVLDELEAAVARGLEQAAALRQSILKKAFAGRLLSAAERAALRADPAWEPAAKLLERIRGERAKTNRQGAKRARRRRP